MLPHGDRMPQAPQPQAPHPASQQPPTQPQPQQRHAAADRSRMPVAEAMGLDPTRLPAEIFSRYCTELRKTDEERNLKARENFGKPGRDPVKITIAFSLLTRDPIWRRGLAVAQLSQHWSDLVGEGIAMNSTPVSFRDGVLTIKPKSTVWAQQLRLMAPQIAAKLRERVDGLDIREVHVAAANNITFRRGKWDVKGRGVRDTYF
ncbi:DUF721 domain-containing protein [Pseudoscardovia radai]|uniref:DUF721 domain-containing protein n=1 Tax=Pseudoscardovia radai TaxID=987066 RepID=UPI003991439B